MPQKFLNELINNYSSFFKKEYDQDKYPNQDIHSCTALYDLCISLNPDYIIDIGTNFGASTLSFARALKNLDKPLSLLTTIDKNQKHWRERTSKIQSDLLKKEDMDIKQINVIEADFLSIDPTKLLKDMKGFVFYDIHDNDIESYSDIFIMNWIPLLKDAILAIHDCSHVSESYILRTNYKGYTMTKQRHFSGKIYAGFAECEKFIAWANKKKQPIFDVPLTSLVYFKIRNGE